MPWKAELPGERPTLGAGVVAWIESNLASPDGREGLVELTREQVDFTLRLYELDPLTGRRRFRRAVLSRAKGWGRSPYLAMLAAAEAFCDVVPAGWDRDGRPVGKPWSAVRSVWIQVLAVSESQTKNSWLPLTEMVADGPAGKLRGVDVMTTFITLPARGRIEFNTASAISREGNRPCFAVLDQTESWTVQNRGVALAATVRRNAGKVGGATIESPNAYRPGSGSVSERSALYAEKIRLGRTVDDGLLYDHREAPPAVELVAGVTDAELIEGLRWVYGDSSDHPAGCVLHDPPCPPGWVPRARGPRDPRRGHRTGRRLPVLPQPAHQPARLIHHGRNAGTACRSRLDR